MTERRRYRNLVFDSTRWDGFVFRPNDIVISTPPKCGGRAAVGLDDLAELGPPRSPARPDGPVLGVDGGTA